MILADNTKRVCGLFVCGQATFELLKRENLDYLMFITALFLVWTLGHMSHHVTEWVTKTAQLPKEFELAPYQSVCATYWAICNTLSCMW